MTERKDVAVVGAGPFGLSVAAHLAPTLKVRVFGRPMETWRARMPPAMLLRSAWEETSLSAPGDRGTIDAWIAESGEPREEPIPLAKFLRYSDWFRDRFVPDSDPADVASIEAIDDGYRIETEAGDVVEVGAVVIAVGVLPFAHAPEPFADAVGDRVRFATEDHAAERFRGQRVAVIGGGQNALETAAVAAEAGAEVEVIVRGEVHWFADREPHNPRGALGRKLYRLAYPAVGYGPPPLNRLVLHPDLFAALPPRLRRRLNTRLLRPGASPWLRERISEGVRLTENRAVTSLRQTEDSVRLELEDGTTRETDSAILATGYRFSLERLPFLSERLRARIRVEEGWPVLDRHFRSTDPGIFFVGYPAERRFGPISRFVLGTRFTANRVAEAFAAERGGVSVLLAADDHYGALGGLRALRAAGYEPWLATPSASTYAARSRASAGTIRVPAPSGGNREFMRAIAHAAERTGAAAVLPGSEDTLVALAEGRHLLPPGTAAGVPSRQAVQRATDKSALAHLARDAGLELPPTRELDATDLDTEAAELTFPAVVKPLRTKTFTQQGFRHGRVQRVDNAAELARVARQLPGERWIVQPFLEGRLAAVCGVAWEGELVCAIHQEALRITPPETGVSAYAVTVPPDEALEDAMARLVRSIGWSGIFQAQFIRTEGHDYLIDFNPRMYGSIALAVRAGLNLPAIWLELVLGREPDVGEYRVGVRYRAEEKDARALARSALRGRPQDALRGIAPRRNTAHAVFSLRDPLPLLTSFGKLRAVRRD